MIKRILLCLFLMIFGIHCAAEDITDMDINAKLTLKARYNVSQSVIYSSDLFPQIHKKFKIATMPMDKLSFKVKSVDIKLIFARFGYEITSFEDEFVEFVFLGDMLEQKPKEFIKKMYIEYYDENLKLKDIIIRPLGTLPTQYEVISFNIAPNALKKPSGSFEMTYRIENKHKKISFIYAVVGEINILKANKNLHTNDELNAQNTRIERVVFEKNHTQYAYKTDIDKHSAKSFIRADSIITKDKIKPRIIVKKGENLLAQSQSDGVKLEVRLIARENGAFNDIINAQNPQSGKIIRVKVISEGRADIL